MTLSRSGPWAMSFRSITFLLCFFMVNSWFRNLMVLSPRISRVKSARKLPSTTWPSAAGKVRCTLNFLCLIQPFFYVICQLVRKNFCAGDFTTTVKKNSIGQLLKTFQVPTIYTGYNEPDVRLSNNKIGRIPVFGQICLNRDYEFDIGKSVQMHFSPPIFCCR